MGSRVARPGITNSRPLGREIERVTSGNHAIRFDCAVGVRSWRFSTIAFPETRLYFGGRRRDEARHISDFVRSLTHRMTGEIVNLNKARKAKARADKDRKAEENRVRFGRTKAEREKDEAQRALEKSRLEALRRDRDDEVPSS